MADEQLMEPCEDTTMTEDEKEPTSEQVEAIESASEGAPDDFSE